MICEIQGILIGILCVLRLPVASRQRISQTAMSLVKLSTNGQVTIPSALRERAGLDPGDPLEAKLEKGKITLTPKSFIDQRIDEGLEDIRKGRTYGPFDSADEMIESLRRNLKRQVKSGKPRRSR